MTGAGPVEIRPQEKQELFLSSPADIVVYGGAAGGGKTFGLCMEPLRNKDVPGFSCAVFRKNAKDFRGRGGIWDEMAGLYPSTGAKEKESELQWTWPSGAQVQGFHLEHESAKYKHQGKQYALILIDELTQISESQFFFLLSRNRTTCGVRPYLRATCNADAESWVAEFIDWWIGEDGFPIEERIGELRWVIRDGSTLIWGDSMEDVIDRVPHIIEKNKALGIDPEHLVSSVTFIPAKLEDNPALTDADPGYVGKLHMLDPVEHDRLRWGNWKIRAGAGSMFKRDFFKIVDEPPREPLFMMRAWDKAATEERDGEDPDWTVGTLIADLGNGDVCIMDIERFRADPGDTESKILFTASMDGKDVEIVFEQEPGSSGKSDVDHYARKLAGYVVHSVRHTGSKIVRARPASAAAKLGHVYVLRRSWTMEFIREAENFPSRAHDDQVDAFSLGFNQLYEDAPDPDIGVGRFGSGRRANDYGL